MSLIEKALEKQGKGIPGIRKQPDRATRSADPQPADSGTAPVASADTVVKLNRDYLLSNGFVTPETGYTAIAHQFRRLKQPIMRKAFQEGAGANSNVVVVTSTGSREGKSFISANLAISVAMELDRTVLLIDADVIKKTLSSTLLDFSDQPPGILELLSGSVRDLGDVLLKTDMDRLTVVPAGIGSMNFAEHLSSGKMKQLIREVANRYSNRLIILDSPPVSAGAESSILTELAGQVIFVVEAEKTLSHHVMEAIRQIDAKKITGLVLNKSNQHDSDELYTEYSSYRPPG